jgi:hypothetical protein
MEVAKTIAEVIQKDLLPGSQINNDPDLGVKSIGYSDYAD